MKTLFRLSGFTGIIYIIGCAGGTDTDSLDFYGALTRTLLAIAFCAACFAAARLCEKRKCAKKSAVRRKKVCRRNSAAVGYGNFEISAEPIRKNLSGVNAECL